MVSNKIQPALDSVSLHVNKPCPLILRSGTSYSVRSSKYATGEVSYSTLIFCKIRKPAHIYQVLRVKDYNVLRSSKSAAPKPPASNSDEAKQQIDNRVRLASL